MRKWDSCQQSAGPYKGHISSSIIALIFLFLLQARLQYFFVVMSLIIFNVEM